MTEGVILLHGILGEKKCMKKFADFLENNGYKTLNIGYASSKYDISTICNHIHAEILDFSNKVDKINFIGFSLGGLIIRAYLNINKPTNLNRVVMIGTPNKGSEIADYLKNYWIYKKLYGPAGQQLTTDQSNFREIFGNIYYELGVIAGESSVNFIANKIINQSNDGRVSIINTYIKGLSDHIVIKSHHRKLTSNQQVWKLSLDFLNKGKFG